MKLYAELEEYIGALPFDSIEESRKSILNEVSEYVQNTPAPKVNFICTHNSRRSHLSQIWAQTMANHFGVKIDSFSGGTEATAFHPNAVAALERAGFRIENPGGSNPHFEVRFSEESDPLVCYSKKFDDSPNPLTGFAAVMTCSEADAECPVVFGASDRIKLFYEDPKVADGTDSESITYDERSLQIATEMFFIFSQIKSA